MNLFDIFRKPKQQLSEGGNLALDTGDEAQHIDLKVHNRNYIVPILDKLLLSINDLYAQQYQVPLWNPKLLQSKSFLSGSSLHFFNTDIPDDEFTRVKPKVGDIDTQVNKEYEGNLEQFLTANKGKVMGPAKFLGFQRGNEQFSGLWEFTDPPIKVQIDLEFVKYEKDKPTAWSQFSHSSSWDDLQAGIKGVFHKFLIQSFTSLTEQEFILRKFVGRGKARAEQDFPTTDNMFSFAVSSKEGGGLRAKYEPVLDEKGRPLVVDGLPVMRPLKAEDYEQDLSTIFATIFGSRVNSVQLKKLMPKTWSFVGLLELMNAVLDSEEKERVVDSFINKLFAPGAQGLYKNDPDRDIVEKNAAVNQMLAVLKSTPPTNLEQMRQDYKANYRMTGNKSPTQAVDEAAEDTPAPVKAQFRKGMPHLHDLKPVDFLDLLDEIHDGNGNFKLENIPLNVKVDGFGGRFGKDAQGRPFMATSRTEPRYQAGFVKYHQDKGTTDPEILGRAQLFDQLFNEMMSAVKLVDSKLGPDFLVNKQITCEVLFLPFATETPEGKLKFVGIQYDKLPEGVQLALVPFRVVDAATGEDLPNSNKVIKELLSVGRNGSVMFIDNSLTQKEGLDVTAIVPPLENIEQLRALLADKSAGSLQRKRDVAAALEPFKIALEKAIIEDPNIIGKDILGQDYEGIVINSRLGPIKVTSQQQRDVIQAKQDAKKAAWTERPRENSNKTAVVAVGSFIGHKGHEELFNYTINKAKELGGDPYLFIGNAEGKDDPIPPAVKVQTWHKLYPEYADNISTVQAGGQLIQKIKHELINPLPGKPPRYDNIVIMVGEDRAGMNMPAALMKAVNKFQGYEHVKVSLEVTPRGTGISGTALRNSLKNDSPEKALAFWSNAFDVKKLGKDWILHLMDITKKGMGIAQQPAVQQPAPVAERLFNSLIRPKVDEATFENDPWGDQGNFAGDRPVNVGGDTVKQLGIGDIVSYLGQKAKIEAQSKDRKYSRITIFSNFGGTTKDVLTSDLKRLSKDVDEGQTADMRAFFAGADSDKPIPNVQRSIKPEEIKKLMARLLATGEKGLTPAQLELVRNYQLGQKIYTRKVETESDNTTESAGVGIITKQNSTVDVNKNTPMKNLKAFNLAEEPLDELTGYGSDKKYENIGSYKRYVIYVGRQKYNNLYFIAVAENPRTLEAKFKAKGKTRQEAVDNLQIEIDKEIDVATKVSGQAILDFNVDFVKEILELSSDVFYAKIIAGPRLVLAGPEMMQYPDIMRDEGFKPSTIRTYKGGEGTTKLPGVPLSAKAAVAANLIANGRYVLGNETIDKDGNRVFELQFDSVVQASNEKMRLRAPAVTVGTNRSQGVEEKMMPASNFVGSKQNPINGKGIKRGNDPTPVKAGDLVGEENVEQEHIVKVKGGYELRSKHGNKNLGKYPTKAGAEKRERQVQYFKHMNEDVENIMDALINKIIENEAVQNKK